MAPSIIVPSTAAVRAALRGYRGGRLGFPGNAASLARHHRAGFRVIGTRERIGKHHGQWRDVVLVERRSPKVA